MSTALITYLHYQPKAGPYSYFDVGKKGYYSEEERKLGFQKFLTSAVEPLLSFLEKDASRKVNLCLTIPVLEYLQDDSSFLVRIEKLLKGGQVELIAGRGYDSFAVLFARKLLTQEIARQKELLAKLFSVKPVGFMNTALLYSDQFGELVESQGFEYAIVPKISWFFNENGMSLFKARQGNLRLFVVDNDANAGSLEPAQVRLLETVNLKNINQDDGFSLLSELKSEQQLSEYGLPDLVAYDTVAGGLEMIVGNNLQKDFLARLKELGKQVAETSLTESKADFLWLGSLAHFKALSNNSEGRYKMYTKLLTMLYDLEIRLR